MVVACALCGFVNRTTKVILQVDRLTIEVGQLLAFEGGHEAIRSMFEADGYYHANVGLEDLYRLRIYMCKDICPWHVGIRRRRIRRN
jgi:hypothetical protein